MTTKEYFADLAARVAATHGAQCETAVALRYVASHGRLDEKCARPSREAWAADLLAFDNAVTA